LGEELKKEVDAEVDLLAGSGGVYDIRLDGKLIFSKGRMGRFPEPAEIISLIKKN